MPISSSGSDTELTSRAKLFGRQRPIYDVLGGGKVADILLWRNTMVSATLLAVTTVIWYLFEVAEYKFVTLLCHISITAMLVFFIWCSGAEIFKWNPPKMPQIILQESSFKEAATTFHKRFNDFLSKLFDIACGRDPPLFFLTIFSLYILSVIGSYISFLSLFYFGLLCVETLPYLYGRYEEDVDRLAGRTTHKMKKSYEQFDQNFLNKIPRGPVKGKKLR